MKQAEFLARSKGITYTAIGKELGVSTSLVSRTIRGAAAPYPKLRDGIARILDWQGDPSELFIEVEVADHEDR